MIAFPVNVALTAIFVFTGLYCLYHFIAAQRSKSAGSPALTDGQVVDINHLIMSAAMIFMTWVMFGDVLLWGQVALFAVLLLSLIPNWLRARGLTERLDVAGHMLLDLAMIWMLAAMPLLMAGMDHGAHGDHGDHADHSDHSDHGGHGGHEMDMAADTPAWADAVNVGFVAICGLVAAWWLLRAVREPRHRLHSVCHLLMSVGMGVMLVAMNA
ncbi:DUF5134 domain-containing protein [Enemella sp. A6]|uniref:DUF5134 domain-containing protein n=1 Tax=Enemella sp. A6 TaxID=3440152 RepID=UPI003EBEC8BA